MPPCSQKAASSGSQWSIQRADTWWSKGFSEHNGQVALRLNEGEHPLVVASDSGVGPGELISLAYRLEPKVRIWGEHGVGSPPLTGITDLVALTPSTTLSSQLESSYQMVPLANTWQWLVAQPLPLAPPSPRVAQTSSVPEAEPASFPPPVYVPAPKADPLPTP